jgi:hypothetical protein
MADIKQAYGAESTLTMTLASLGNNNARESTAVDNGTDGFLDALVQFQIAVGTGATAGSFIEIRAYASVDDGTTYSDTATGTNAAITLTSPENAPLVDTISTPVASTTYTSNPASVAKAFGGSLPKKWGIIIVNRSNTTLSGTEGNHLKLWQGTYEVVN